MPQLITPQTSQANEKVVVLEHVHTKRLFMVTEAMLQTPNFAAVIARQPFRRHEVHTAAEYDRWAKRIIQQERQRDEQADYLHECRMDETRKRMRSDLSHRLLFAQPHERQVIEATLRALDHLQRRKERARESYFMRWAHEDSNKTAGEIVTSDIIGGR